MVAAAAAAPLVLAFEPLARAGLQLAQTPVLGWERVETWTKGRKRPRSVVQRSSFTLRAWEVAALGVVGAVGYWVVTRPDQSTPSGFNPLWLFPVTWPWTKPWEG